MRDAKTRDPRTIEIIVTYECHCGAKTTAKGVGDPLELKQGIMPTMPMAPPRWERGPHVACSMSWEIRWPDGINGSAEGGIEEGECSSTKES